MKTVVLNEEEIKQLIADAVSETLDKKLPSVIRKANRPEWLSPTEIEKEYKITRRSQQHLREKKRFQYRKVGKRILIHRDEIEKYLESIRINAK